MKRTGMTKTNKKYEDDKNRERRIRSDITVFPLCHAVVKLFSLRKGWVMVMVSLISCLLPWYARFSRFCLCTSFDDLEANKKQLTENVMLRIMLL